MDSRGLSLKTVVDELLFVSSQLGDKRQWEQFDVVKGQEPSWLLFYYCIEKNKKLHSVYQLFINVMYIYIYIYILFFYHSL